MYNSTSIRSLATISETKKKKNERKRKSFFSQEHRSQSTLYSQTFFNHRSLLNYLRNRKLKIKLKIKKKTIRTIIEKRKSSGNLLEKKRRMKILVT